MSDPFVQSDRDEGLVVVLDCQQHKGKVDFLLSICLGVHCHKEAEVELLNTFNRCKQKLFNLQRRIHYVLASKGVLQMSVRTVGQEFGQQAAAKLEMFRSMRIGTKHKA